MNCKVAACTRPGQLAVIDRAGLPFLAGTNFLPTAHFVTDINITHDGNVFGGTRLRFAPGFSALSKLSDAGMQTSLQTPKSKNLTQKEVTQKEVT